MTINVNKVKLLTVNLDSNAVLKKKIMGTKKKYHCAGLKSATLYMVSSMIVMTKIILKWRHVFSINKIIKQYFFKSRTVRIQSKMITTVLNIPIPTYTSYST